MLGRDWDDGDRPPLINSNLYQSCSAATNLIFGGGNFAEWQKRGRDVNSVIADSGCKDPVNLDFSLAPDANACKLIGFRSFDDEIKTAGLTCDKSWIKLPASYTPRTPTKTWTKQDLIKFAAFDLDFNQTAVDKPPLGIHQQNGDGAGFFVTREVAGYKGPACLKAVDRKALQKSFYPYLSIDKLRKLDESPVKLTFAIMQPKINAGSMTIEFRGDGQTRESGPHLNFTKDGKVSAAGKEVARLTPEEWTHFTIEFGLKDQNTGSWNLTIKNKQETKILTLPFRHKEFNDISWIGIMADSSEDSVFYLDDISFKFGEQAKF